MRRITIDFVVVVVGRVCYWGVNFLFVHLKILEAKRGVVDMGSLLLEAFEHFRMRAALVVTLLLPIIRELHFTSGAVKVLRLQPLLTAAATFSLAIGSDRGF